MEIQTGGYEVSFKLLWEEHQEMAEGGGIELCQITINTRDKRVIAVICLRSREWNGTHIFRTNACVIRTRQVSSYSLDRVFVSWF